MPFWAASGSGAWCPGQGDLGVLAVKLWDASRHEHENNHSQSADALQGWSALWICHEATYENKKASPAVPRHHLFFETVTEPEC